VPATLGTLAKLQVQVARAAWGSSGRSGVVPTRHLKYNPKKMNAKYSRGRILLILCACTLSSQRAGGFSVHRQTSQPSSADNLIDDDDYSQPPSMPAAPLEGADIAIRTALSTTIDELGEAIGGRGRARCDFPRCSSFL